MPDSFKEQASVIPTNRGANPIEFYAEEFRQEPSSADGFRQQVVEWFFAVKHLRFFEVNRLTYNSDPEDLRIHRLVCSALINFGELAAMRAARLRSESGLESLGLSTECVEAETRLLRDNFKMFHDRTMSLSEAESILSDAFHES